MQVNSASTLPQLNAYITSHSSTSPTRPFLPGVIDCGYLLLCCWIHPDWAGLRLSFCRGYWRMVLSCPFPQKWIQSVVLSFCPSSLSLPSLSHSLSLSFAFSLSLSLSLSLSPTLSRYGQSVHRSQPGLFPYICMVYIIGFIPFSIYLIYLSISPSLSFLIPLPLSLTIFHEHYQLYTTITRRSLPSHSRTYIHACSRTFDPASTPCFSTSL
eukprot:sb/3470137/